MAKGFFGIFKSMPEPERKPAGSLLFADPSTRERTEHIHTFNEPHGNNSHGEQSGIESPGRWTDTYANMRRKQGHDG